MSLITVEKFAEVYASGYLPVDLKVKPDPRTEQQGDALIKKRDCLRLGATCDKK